MKNQSEVVLLIDTPYRPEPGWFSRVKAVNNGRYAVEQWIRCRELWHYKLKNSKLFFMAHDTGKTRAVTMFMQKVEDVLNVMPRSRYGPTQRKNICWVEPSAWWLKCGMRRSLYTILLRVAHFYKTEEDNFESALMHHEYLKATQYAVKRFFEGNTVYTGKRRGWYRQFAVLSPTSKETDCLLIREKQ